MNERDGHDAEEGRDPEQGDGDVQVGCNDIDHPVRR